MIALDEGLKANRPVLATAPAASVRGDSSRAPSSKTDLKNAAPELDGPQHAPGFMKVGPSRVRMEAWRRAFTPSLIVITLPELAASGATTPPEEARPRFARTGCGLRPQLGERSSRRLPQTRLRHPPSAPLLAGRVGFGGKSGRDPPRRRSPGVAGRGPPRRPRLDSLAFSWKAAGSGASSPARGRRDVVPAPRRRPPRSRGGG